MVKLKFETTIAITVRNISDKCLISFERAHHVLFFRSCFTSCKQIEKHYIKSATGLSVIVGGGLMKPPFKDRRLVQTYHTLKFSTKVFFVGMLSWHYKVQFSRHLVAENDEGICIISSCTDDKRVLQFTVSDGLHSLKMSKSNSAVFTFEPKDEY